LAVTEVENFVHNLNDLAILESIEFMRKKEFSFIEVVEKSINIVDIVAS
jgi:hypothetical protein